MFPLFAQIDSLNAENALVATDFWTWLLLFIFFAIGYIYYGLVWLILLGMANQHHLLSQQKFYYSIFAITFLTTCSNFLFLFLYGKTGIILAALVIFIINFVVIKYAWKLENQKIIIYSLIVTFVTAPWFLFIVK